MSEGFAKFKESNRNSLDFSTTLEDVALAAWNAALAERDKKTCECKDGYVCFLAPGTETYKDALENERYCGKCGKMTKFYRKFLEGEAR